MSSVAKVYDAVVIGAGPGGYVAAIRLGQLGKKTLIIDRDADRLGGVCLNEGCIPSKALIRAAALYRRLQDGVGDLGIEIHGEVSFDPRRLQQYKQGVIDRLRTGIGQLLRRNKVEFLAGSARLTGAKTLQVEGPEGAVEVSADAIVVATGSSPIQLPFLPWSPRVIDSTAALNLAEVPPRVAVIGGGVIGLEIGTYFLNLGSELTVVEMLPQLLPGTDPDLVRVVARRLKQRGAAVHLNARALGAETGEAGVSLRFARKDGSEETVEVDYVLVAVGRRANSAGLGLEKLGVRLGDDGRIQVDDQQRSSLPTVFAIGDVVPGAWLAHKASKEGVVAAEVIAGMKTVADWKTIPGAIFTDPEVAIAGIGEVEAKERGIAVKVGKFPFAGSGRALVAGETDGFVKVIAAADDDRLLGVGIVGAEASDLIS